VTEREWLKLFGEFSRLKADQRARHEYDEWCQRSVARGMASLYAIVKQRADEFRRFTGIDIAITPPSHSDTALGSAGPWMTSMAIEVGNAQVYVYSSRFSGVMPQVRIAARRGRGRRMGRMITWHSCTLCPRPQGEVELYEFKPGTEGLGPRLSLDDFVFKAFDSLLRCVTSSQKPAMQRLLAGWPITPVPILETRDLAVGRREQGFTRRQVTLKTFAIPQANQPSRGLSAKAPPNRTTPVQFN